MKFVILALLIATFAHAAPSPTPSASPNPSIITAPPSPILLTTAQAQAAALIRIKSYDTSLFNQLVSTVQNVTGVIFHNPNGLTAQQVFTGLGVKQCDVQKKLLAFSTLINAVIPGTIPAEPVTSVAMTGTGAACVVTVSQ